MKNRLRDQELHDLRQIHKAAVKLEKYFINKVNFSVSAVDANAINALNEFCLLLTNQRLKGLGTNENTAPTRP
jgi:hypothetical protein